MALTRYEGSENQGGVCQLRILKRCDFEANQVILQRYRGEGIIKISANDTLENVFPINYFTHFVAEHKQPSNRSQYGLAFEQGFTFALSKDRSDILAQITQLQDEPLIIIFKNNNHDWKVIGTEEDWAMIEVAQETGKRPSDGNQYFFDVKCPSRYLSPFLAFEEREEEIVIPSGCFESGEGFSHNQNYSHEIRKDYNYGRYNRVGTYKLIYSLELSTRIRIIYIGDASVIDDRVVTAALEGEYTFVTNGNYFKVIVEIIAKRQDLQPQNYVSVAPPCLPSP